MKRLMFLLFLPVFMYGQVIVNTPKEGIGEQSDFLRVVSTSTGSAVSGAFIKDRQYATGSRSASSYAHFPTVGVSDSTIGDLSWFNRDSIKADDGKRAFSTSASQNDSTHYLVANDFVFDLPADAVVTGFTVAIEANGSDSASYITTLVKLAKDGTIGGSDYATDATVSDDVTIYSFGGADSLWGETWTVADVEDSALGVVVIFKDTSAAASKVIYVDYIKLTVHYTYLALAIDVDTTQYIPTFRGSELWLQIAAEDSISLIPSYQTSLDAENWTPEVPMDSLKITTESYKLKAWNLSTVADSVQYIRFLLDIDRDAYAPGTTTAYYSATYAIKRD